jgi:hypothetical protein
MWIRPLALAAAALLLAAVVPAGGGVLVLIAAGACAWAFAVGVLPRFRPRDAYDLGELRRVHESEELRALDDEGALGAPEKVICLRCMTEYDYRLGACPRCGLSR